MPALEPRVATVLLLLIAGMSGEACTRETHLEREAYRKIDSVSVGEIRVI